MAKLKCFQYLVFCFFFLETSNGNPLGETVNDVSKKDCEGKASNWNAGLNTNVGLQLPSFGAAGGLKWDPPKLPDIFKLPSANGDLSVKTNPFGGLFNISNSLGSANVALKLPEAKFDFKLPSFQTPTPIWNLPAVPDLFKGFPNLGGINATLKINSNGLPSINGALDHLTDIFKDFKGINASANFNFKGFSNLKALTTDPNFMNNFWKLLNCVIDFTKSLNIDFKPIQNYLRGFQGLTVPPNLLDNLTKGVKGLKIDTNLVNEIASWINNLKVGLQIDPIKIEVSLGGVEGLASINALLAPYIETVAAGLGAIDAVTLTQVIEGILGLLLIL